MGAFLEIEWHPCRAKVHIDPLLDTDAARPDIQTQQLAHVRPMRLERRPQHLRPLPRLAAQRLHDRAGLLVVAPDQDRRAGAGDRGAEGAEGPRTLDDLHRAGEEVGAVGLMEAVGEAAADEVPVAAGQTERQQRGVGDVGDRVGHRDR
jgi:hypothetical protein